MRHPPRILLAILSALALLVLAEPAVQRSALAQPNRTAEIATYEGADREQRLL